MCVSAFTLSSAQQAAEYFGDDQQTTFTNVELGDLSLRSIVDIGSQLRSAVPNAHVSISSSQVTPDSYIKAFIQTDIPTVNFIENSHLRDEFPGEYHLSSGKWPQTPFAVVISPHLASVLGNLKRFSALSGNATFHVVGIASDSYAKNDDSIIAGPGTWESIPRPDPDHAYQSVQAEVNVSWGARGSVSAVTMVLAAVLPSLPSNQGSRTT